MEHPGTVISVEAIERLTEVYPHLTYWLVAQLKTGILQVEGFNCMEQYTINFANVKKGEFYTHYVGRKNKTYLLEESKLANPFTIKKELEREQAITDYMFWLEEALDDPMGDAFEELESLVDYLLENKSLTLACFCKPKPCHAEVLAERIVIRAKQKYLASKVASNGVEPTFNIQTPQRGGKRTSRGKQKPLAIALQSEWTRQKAETCTLCSLCDNRTHSVWIRGEGQKKLMIIGEAPGENEDKFALPFIGQSGKMLEVALQSIGLESQRDCWIVNSVKCRPPENRDPSAAEIKKCLPYLISQILELRPKVILALGKYGSSLLTGEKKFKISIHRGKIYRFDLSEYVQMDEPLIIPVVPTFHPAYLLRNPQKTMASPKYYVWKDLITVSKLLQE